MIDTIALTGGEAYAIGGWLDRDRTTDVSLSDDSTTTTYLATGELE